MKKPSLIFSLVASVSLLTACGKKDVDKVGEAQACLDSATAATASACMDKVTGLESSQSYVIRCAATFIAEGFDQATRLSSAYDNMNTSGSGAGGTSASVAAMDVLAFTSGTAAADINLGYCNKSASKGLIMLSSIANMATHIKAVAACGSVSACLSAAQSDPAAQAAVGAAAAAAYVSNCTASQTSNQQFCNQFSTAVTAAGGTTDSSCLGKQLMAQYNNTTTTCP